MSIGEILKELRETSGLNKKEIAEKLGMPYTTYNNYETGTRDVGSDTLKRIARFYGVTVDYLLENQILELPPEGHVIDDPELTEYLEELHKRPEMKMLFKLSKKATKEQVEQVVKMIESFKGPSED